MAGVTKVKIEESAEELHELLRKQKTALGKERIQVLYLLKIGQVKTIQELAVVLGRGSATVQRWLKADTESGITTLGARKKGSLSTANYQGRRERATFKRIRRPPGMQKLCRNQNMVKSGGRGRCF